MKQQVKLRESNYILEDNGQYVVISTATRRVKKFKVDQLTKDLIAGMKDEESVEKLIENLSSKYDTSNLVSCLNSLEKEGIVRKYEDNVSNQKYSRQIMFIDELTSSWDETLKLQKKIEDSKIAVFGVGGIGTWIVNSLYQMGVGEIRITDPDIVSESNLNRQLYFDSRDIGKFKVDVLKDKLFDANIIPFKKTVDRNSNLEEIIEGCNFLVNCADSPSIVETTRILDDYATKHNIAYCVAGGYNMHLGMVGPLIVPGKTATFDNFMEFQRANDPFSNLKKIKDIEQTGNLGPIAGAIANIQAMEIFKYIIGKGTHNFNRFAEINFMDLSLEWRNYSKPK